MKICHLTSAHPRFDTRIFLKMCCSATIAGHDIALITADGCGEERKSDVSISDVGAPRTRLSRMTLAAFRVYRAARHCDADIYHFHDPELIPFAVLMSVIHRKKVVFDWHEDVPKQLLTKPYFGWATAKLAAATFAIFEKFVCKLFDALVVATPALQAKFSKSHASVTLVNNYPMQAELFAEHRNKSELAALSICYVGNIAGIRGIENVIEALDLLAVEATLKLAGKFETDDLRSRVQSAPGWRRVDELGFCDRAQVAHLMAESCAGIVTFLPAPNHIESQPNKLFEYMSAGLPVVASNFPLWEQLICDERCGVCVDPENPVEIAEAIEFLILNPREASEMGRRGRSAVVRQYNWDCEWQKLHQLYSKIYVRSE